MNRDWHYCMLRRNRWVVTDIYVLSVDSGQEFLISLFSQSGVFSFVFCFSFFFFAEMLLKKRTVIIVLNRIAELCLSCIKQYNFLFYYSQILRLPAVQSSPVYAIRPECICCVHTDEGIFLHVIIPVCTYCPFVRLARFNFWLQGLEITKNSCPM